MFKDRRLAVVMLIIVVTFIGFGIIIPVLPELINVSAANHAQYHVGLMLSIYSAVSFLVSPIWGAWSDRIGRRPILLSGLLGFACSFFIFAIADSELWLMYASRIVGGLFSGAVISVIVAYVSDITSIEDRTRGMGVVGMSIGLGFMIGPGVGGMLSTVSNYTPFYVSAALSLLAFALAYRMLPESLALESRNQTARTKESRWTAFRGKLKYLYVLILFVSFSLAGLEATLQLFGIERYEVTPVQIGWMFVLSGVIGAFMQGFFIRKFIKPGSESKAIFIGILVSGVAYGLLATSHSHLMTTLFLGLFSVGNSLIRPCVTSLITQQTTVGTGAASGLSSSMDSLGRITGPLVGTTLFSIQIALPYVIGGLLSIIVLLLVLRYRHLDLRKE